MSRIWEVFGLWMQSEMGTVNLGKFKFSTEKDAIVLLYLFVLFYSFHTQGNRFFYRALSTVLGSIGRDLDYDNVRECAVRGNYMNFLSIYQVLKSKYALV